MDKYLGKRLEGRYEIQELIGVGGMANVYKAFDVIDERTVAVKILREEFLGNTEFLRRFKNESKAIAVLSHPNIVRVFDVSFNNAAIHSIVMEYIDGITLKDYIERQGLLTWKEAVHFTLQILRALQHAHDKGIVHRDIKPQNIMLLQNGTIKVTDFGIARFARSEVKTISDRAIGSVHYISPEQAMGDATDEKSDLYSVGVMLFEMLTGRLPFEADTAVSVALKQIQTQAVMPRSINPDIPEGLEDITVRAMQKDSVNRYQSAAEMIADIEKFRKDPSIHFQYKYADPQGAKAKRQKKAGKTRAVDPMEEDDMPVKRRTPYIPILTGVTMAFVLASACFISLMVYYNNPFVQVEETTMPNLVGLKYETVAAQYNDFVLVAEEDEIYTDEYSKGVIIEQTPRAGVKIKMGATATVSVSAGQRVVTLPNFADKEVNQVISRLRDLGLEYEEQQVYSDEVARRCVVYTDPSRDSELPSGTKVTLYVSMGPETVFVTVPDVVGLTQDGARQKLELYNLKLGEVAEEASDLPAGTVIRQIPEAGGMQADDLPVNIVVSAEGMVAVPIAISLPPNMDREVMVRIKTGPAENVEFQETLNPAETGVIRPSFTGAEDDPELQIKVYVDGRLYVEYFADFTTGSYREGRDRTGEPEFQQ